MITFAWGKEVENGITRHAKGMGGTIVGGCKAAVAAGLSILKQDGNAADTVTATLLVLSITYVGYYVICAEASFIIYDENKEEVKVLSRPGGAPLGLQAMDWYYKRGYLEMVV